MTTIEENKLIAEFMGGSYEENYKRAPSDIPVFAMYASSLEDLKYHSSWDWLMPVINKIIDTIGVRTIDECSAEEWRVTTSIARMYIGVDILQAHHYVTEFIEWYNKNKEQ